MKIFLLTIKKYGGYDSYDSFVVAGESEEWVRSRWKKGENKYSCGSECHCRYSDYDCAWSSAPFSTCTCIGEANEGVEEGIVCASFNAG